MKGMSQGLWHKKSDEQTSQTMIDFALYRAYKVLVIATVLRLLSRERGRPCLPTLPVGHDQGTMAHPSIHGWVAPYTTRKRGITACVRNTEDER
jgi:hypothetical protein